MNKLERLLKLLIPASLALKILRYVITLRPSLARAIINGATRPFGKQKKYVHKVCNENWEGTLIMPEISSCTYASAIKRLQSADIVIFYIHGGGFRAGHSTMFMKSFINWIELTKKKHNLNAAIMSVDYELAPKCLYPTPILQCLKAYKHLVEDLGVHPSKIIVSGDSAGGGIAIETLVRNYAVSMLSDLSKPRTNVQMGLPAGALLISPLVSGNDTSISWKLYQDKDVVSRQLRQLVFDEYIYSPNAKLDDLHLFKFATVKTGFKRFLPKHIMVTVGGVETMRDDILSFFETVEQEGTRNVTVIREEYAHDWFVVHDIIPDKKREDIIEKYNEQFVDFAVHAINTYHDEDLILPTEPMMTMGQPRENSIQERHVKITIVDQPINEKLDIHENRGIVDVITEYLYTTLPQRKPKILD